MSIEFLRDDIEVGLMKNKRVGMKRRTIKIKVLDKGRYKVFEDFVYLPLVKEFVVLRLGGLG